MWLSCVIFRYSVLLIIFGPIPVAARSQAYVCISSLAGIVGSNPANGMDVCVL
jgi:hypothetical protein